MPIPILHSYSTWLHQTQTWMYTQVKHLPKSVVPHIVCHRTANLEQFSVPNIHALREGPAWQWYWDKGLRSLGLRNYIGLLVRVGRRLRAPVVHSHFGPYGWQDLDAVKRIGARHVVTFYGADVNRLPQQEPKWLDRYARLFASIDAVLCEGPHMAGCIESLGCPASKLKVQHLGIELDRFPFQPRKWKPGTPLRVLIASSFREKKGIPYALEALGRLKNDIPLEITIIGDAGNDDAAQAEKKRIHEIIQHYGLDPHLTMLGYQPYDVLIEKAYKNHVYVAASVTASDGDTEGGAPVTIIEMIATGMPVVSTLHCDIPHIIKHKHSGLLAPERNAEALFECLNWLTGHPDCWEDLIQNGRQWIEQEYDAVRQGQKLAAVYNELIS